MSGFVAEMLSRSQKLGYATEEEDVGSNPGRLSYPNRKRRKIFFYMKGTVKKITRPCMRLGEEETVLSVLSPRYRIVILG